MPTTDTHREWMYDKMIKIVTEYSPVFHKHICKGMSAPDSINWTHYFKAHNECPCLLLITNGSQPVMPPCLTSSSSFNTIGFPCDFWFERHQLIKSRDGKVPKGWCKFSVVACAGGTVAAGAALAVVLHVVAAHHKKSTQHVRGLISSVVRVQKY